MTKTLNCLMMIDDNKIDQMLYQRIIERSGLVEETLGFYFAEDALEYLRKPNVTKPDLILLDVNMPRMDGFEFLEKAVELFGATSMSVVVMLTTSLDPKDEARANSFACVKKFLNKPLTLESLKDIVELAG